MSNSTVHSNYGGGGHLDNVNLFGPITNLQSFLAFGEK